MDWYQYTPIVHVLAIKDILKVTPCLIQKLMLTFSSHFDFNRILKVQHIRTQIQKKHEHMGICKPHLGYLGVYLSMYPLIQVFNLPTYLPSLFSLKSTYLLSYLVYLNVWTILEGMEGFNLRVRSFGV